MQVLDWIILAAFTLSMLLGAWRGQVYEVLSVLGWAAAFVLAQWFAPDMAQLLPMRGAGEAVRYAAGFVLVFVLSVFVAALLVVGGRYAGRSEEALDDRIVVRAS